MGGERNAEDGSYLRVRNYAFAPVQHARGLLQKRWAGRGNVFGKLYKE